MEGGEKGLGKEEEEMESSRLELKGKKIEGGTLKGTERKVKRGTDGAIDWHTGDGDGTGLQGWNSVVCCINHCSVPESGRWVCLGQRERERERERETETEW